ncbi:MAG TPA: sugar ABC transporter substrate-binding protein [Candidatus Dormibacteraeota bacterium]|jgi:multiple sugar transport system substrate-binding protein
MRTPLSTLRGTAVAMLAMLAVACGGGTSSNAGGAGTASAAPVTITFWDTNAGPDRTPVWQELIKRFEAANPNITVEYTGIPIAQQLQKLQAAIASGAVPDVANPLSSQLSGMVAQDGLLPLDKQFNSWSGKGDIPASLITSLRALVPDKKLYAIPLSGNMTTLYYRKDWIAQKGLKPPTTWDDFYTDVNALNDPAHNVYGFGFRGATGSASQLENWVFSEAGLTTYFDSKGNASIGSPAAVSVIQKAVGLYGKQTSKDDITHGFPEMVAEFDSGHAAMIMHNLGSYPQHITALGKDAVGAVTLPALSGGKHVLLNSPNISAMVFKGTKHADAAWKFAAFLASADSVSYFNEKIGQIPSNEKVASAQWVKDNTGIQNALATQKLSSTTLVNPPWILPDYSAIESQMEPSLQKMLLGQVTPSQFASTLADKLATSKRQYDQAHKP